MINRRKQMLRNEWRKDPKLASRREIGRRPTWVYRKKYDDMRSVENEQWFNDSENDNTEKDE